MCTHSQGSMVSRRTLLKGAALSVLPLTYMVKPAPADAKPIDLPAPGPADTCPVCGMFVAKYPEWIATIVFSDGFAAHFDGSKDLFKYLLQFEKYAPDRNSADIAAMGVTDYYTVARIEARSARYVIGSDVLGPMGHELIPHASPADAEAFVTDHAGRRTLAFDAVTLPMLTGLDEGRFE